MATTSNYALRLLASLKSEAEKVAAEEGTTLNQFINVAVAEKLAALRTARYFEERASRARAGALSIVSWKPRVMSRRVLATKSCRVHRTPNLGPSRGSLRMVRQAACSRAFLRCQPQWLTPGSRYFSS